MCPLVLPTAINLASGLIAMALTLEPSEIVCSEILRYSYLGTAENELVGESGRGIGQGG